MNTETELKTFLVTNDYFFKTLFRSIEARAVVAGFLSEVTGIAYDVLYNADYQAGELPKQNENEKGKISDCIVKISEKEKVLVEMNNSKTKYIIKKAISYAFSVITESTGINDNYPDVTLVNIDNFNVFDTKKDIVYFKSRSEEGYIEDDLYKSYHVLLENSVNSVYNEVRKFSKLLQMTTVKEMRDYFKGDENYMKAIDKIESFTKDPEFIGYYNKEEQDKFLLKVARSEGIDVGFEQGLEQGLEQGIEQGIDEGRNAEKNEIARNLKLQDMDLQVISSATGLSIEEIEKL